MALSVLMTQRESQLKMIEPPQPLDTERLRMKCSASHDRPLDEVQVVHAPYRLCPLGAHIDHQLGPVSAFATSHGITLAFVPTEDSELVIGSDGFPGQIVIDVAEPQRRQHDWGDYARGAVLALSRHHRLTRGARVVVEGRLNEAGLSSSAAVGLGYLSVLAAVNRIRLDASELVELDRQVENEFLGLKNGVLDPAAIAHARRDRLTIIDCDTQRVEHVGQDAPFTFVAVYSGLQEALVASGKFNNRVDECLEAGGELRRLLGDERPMPQPLGNTSAEEYDSVKSNLPPVLGRRAAHFFSEAARVREGAALFAASDAVGFGQLMTQSALSSINNYETGSDELIALFETLAATGCVYGARFCGAGFRGCCVALVDDARIEAILADAVERYATAYPVHREKIWALVSRPANGLSLL